LFGDAFRTVWFRAAASSAARWSGVRVSRSAARCAGVLDGVVAIGSLSVLVYVQVLHDRGLLLQDQLEPHVYAYSNFTELASLPLHVGNVNPKRFQ